MDTVDYVYRFDPRHPSVKVPPENAEVARKTLEDGNRMFSRWMDRCRTGGSSEAGETYVVACNHLEVGMIRKPDETPKAAPFAVVVGCSDSRVPIEMLFGQGFNDLFVIRVAGNVMGDVCMGSVDFALTALSESVKIVVMLGHGGCGAVTSAVNSYLEPLKFWSKTTSQTLRTIQEQIFVAVREAANGFEEVWGPDASKSPGYRTALIESAVALNAAQSAFVLRQEVERAGKDHQIEVYFGVFNLRNYQVSMPVIPDAPTNDENVRLAQAPSNPDEFLALANEMARLLKPLYFHPEAGPDPITLVDRE